jgi:ribosome biogenesis protein Nip4
LIEFRDIKDKEYDIIKNQISTAFDYEDFDKLIANFDLIIVVGNWKEVLLVPNQLTRIFQEFKKYRNPYFMGIYFGDLKRERFRISLEGITLLSDSVKEKTILTEAGERKILYGRDLSKQDLSYIPSNIQKNNFSILINENQEVLALGKYLFNKGEIETVENKRIILKNVKDKGWYLRKGK